MQLVHIWFGSLWSTPCRFHHSTIQSSTSTWVKAQPSCTGSSLLFSYHFPNNLTKKKKKKNTLSATTVPLRIYHPLIQPKSLSAVNSGSFLWTDVTAWCYSLLYNSYLSFYFSPTSCFELCLSAFPFLLQTKRVPCRLRALDVEKKNPQHRLLEDGERFKYLFEWEESRRYAFILPHLASLKASINNVAPVSCRLSVLEN